MENSIKKMLRLTDKYLTIQGVSYEMFHQTNTLVIKAELAPPLSACLTCGSTARDSEGKMVIVKNGKKMTCIRFDQFNHLPMIMRLKKQRYHCRMVNEFRSHVSAEDKMSFICADGETGQLVNILPTRKLSRLTTYFQTCVNPTDVNYLVTDMNTAYFQLTKKVFPHAKMVIVHFHVVKHMNQAFQDFRVREIKRLMALGNQTMQES